MVMENKSINQIVLEMHDVTTLFVVEYDGAYTDVQVVSSCIICNNSVHEGTLSRIL